jgi:hypothetical protein
MIIYHPLYEYYYQTFQVYKICSKQEFYFGFYCSYYDHDDKRFYHVKNKEIVVYENNLSNFIVIDEEENLNIINKVLKNFNYAELLEGNPDELKKFNHWFMSEDNCEHLKIVDLNLSIKSIRYQATPIEKPWVQCPECAEAFEANEYRKYLECPKCKIALENPYFIGYYPCKTP